jgi:NhaP-type Na+/H+ or K+/H+ antiporter
MFNKKSVRMLSTGLGIVFGSGVGVLASILYSFHIAASIIGGAAVGLLIGIIASMLFGTERGATARKDL